MDLTTRFVTQNMLCTSGYYDEFLWDTNNIRVYIGNFGKILNVFFKSKKNKIVVQNVLTESRNNIVYH